MHNLNTTTSFILTLPTKTCFFPLGITLSDRGSRVTGASSSQSQQQKAESEPASSEVGANSVIFPSKEDEYGIPILQLSSDSDVGLSLIYNI